MRIKIISLFLVLTLLLSLNGVSVFGAGTSESVVDDDFEEGNLTSGWSFSTSSDNNGTSYEVSSLSRIFRIKSSLGGAQTATRKNFKTTSGDVQAFWGTVYVDMVFSLSGITSTQRIFRLQEDNTGNRWTTGLVIIDNRLYYENKGTGERIAVDTDFRFEANRDYNMRISTHMKPGANGAINPVGTAGTYDISIDGKTIATGLPNVHGCQNTQQFLLFQAGEGSWDFKKIAISDSYNGSWTAANFTDDFSKMDSLSSENWVFLSDGANKDKCSALLVSDDYYKDRALVLDASNTNSSNWICGRRDFNTVRGTVLLDIDFCIDGSGTVDMRFMNNEDAYAFFFFVDATGKLKYKTWSGQNVLTDIVVKRNVKHRMQIYYDFSDTSSAVCVFDGEPYVTGGIMPTSSASAINNFKTHVYGDSKLSINSFAITNIPSIPDIAQKNILNINFDESSVGEFPIGWATQNPEMIMVKQDESGSKYVDIEKTISASQLDFFRNFTSFSGLFSVTFNIRPEDGTAKSIHLTDYINRKVDVLPAVDIELNNGELFAYNGNTKIKVADYDIGNWISVKLGIDTVNDCYGISIDGNDVAESLEMRHKVINIANICFSANDNGFSHYMVSGIIIKYLYRSPDETEEAEPIKPNVRNFDSISVVGSPEMYDWLDDFQSEPTGIIYEAEDMELDNYSVHTSSAAHNGKGVYVSRYGTATAAFTFTGESGNYSMNIGYYESLGKYDSEYHLFKNGKEIDFWFGQFDDAKLHVRKVAENISVNNGDVFEIHGVYGSDPCMLDFVEFGEPVCVNVTRGELIDERFWAPSNFARSGWQTDETGGTVKILSSNRTLDLVDNGSAFVSARRVFAEQSRGKFNITFKALIERKLDGIEFRLDSDKEPAVTVFTKNGGLYFKQTGGAEICILDKYVANKIYTVKISLNFDGGSVDVFVDNEISYSENLLINKVNSFFVETPNEGVTHIMLSYVEANCGYIFKEDFALGEIYGWQKIPSELQIQTAGNFSDESEDKSLMLADTGNGQAAMIKHDIISGSAEPLNIEYQFMLPWLFDGAGAVVSDLSTQISFVTENGNLVWKCGNQSGIIWENIKPNVWYDVKLVIDDEKTVVFVNNVPKASDIPFNKTQSLTFGIGKTEMLHGTMYIDDICAYDGAYVCDVPEPVVSHNVNDIKIGVTACDIWHEGQHFGWDSIRAFDNRTSFLGYYDDADPEVADWQIKWMTEHGISLYLTCWYNSGNIDRKPLNSDALHEGFMNAKYFNYIDIGLILLTRESSKEHFLNSTLDYWIEHYLKNPQYYKVDGKPVIFIWDPSYLPFDNVVEEARQKIIAEGFPGAIFITNYLDTSSNIQSYIKAKGYDYVFCYNHNSSVVENQLSVMQQIDDIGTSKLIPFLSQGWGSEAWGLSKRKENVSLSDWQKGLRWIKDYYIPKQPSTSLSSKLLLVGNWNEFGEGNILIPSKLAGFGYLDEIRRVFSASMAEHTDIVPHKRFDNLYPIFEGR